MPRRRRPRNIRWRSDALESSFDHGEKVRVAFTLDCCDREVMGHVATTGGTTAENVRDLMVVTLEYPVGPVSRLVEAIECLTDNGSPYVAGNTRRFAHDIGLVPRTTSVSSPQSNGMAEALIGTLKRGYGSVNPTPDARTVDEQLPAKLTHYNEVHEHKALDHRSLRVYITQGREGHVSHLGGCQYTADQAHNLCCARPLMKTLSQTTEPPGDVSAPTKRFLRRPMTEDIPDDFSTVCVRLADQRLPRSARKSMSRRFTR